MAPYVNPAGTRNSKSGRGDWIQTSDPCAQGERTHTTGGSGRPLPLVFPRKFAMLGQLQETVSRYPIVSQSRAKREM